MSASAEDLRARLARKAAIKRASRQARGLMNRLDREVLAELERIYGETRRLIEQALLAYGPEANLRVENLQALLGQVDARLGQLRRARDELLNAGLAQAAQTGAEVWASAGVAAHTTQRLADDALRFVRSFVARDGLQLSDRLWQLDRGARDVVAGAIERAVIQGQNASRAVQDFLAQGQPVPEDLAEKVGAAQASRVARQAGEALMSGEMNPYDQARRLFRTEINRAHGEAYMAGSEATDGFVGFRFLLSPAHPRPDICDLHAHANLHGLGPGVYPSRDACPWPAHPNTMSYVEVVFEDEISESDRAGRETRRQWLDAQSAERQADVLGGQRKGAAFRAGLLPENAFGTPWRVVERRLRRRGVEVSRFEEG